MAPYPSAPPERPVKMAILDDYQNLSPPYFKDFPRSDLEVSTFADTISPSSDPAALISRLQPFAIISTMRERTPFPREIVSALPNLRMLLTTGMRNNALDLPAFAAANIAVAGTNSDATASPAPPKGFSKTTQHTWALILGLTNNIARDDQTVKSGGWQRELPLSTFLAGQTFACLGLGKLGVAAAKIAVMAFGMRVLAWSASLTQAEADKRASDAGLPSGVFEVAPSKAALIEAADVLSLHYVLSPRSAGIVSSAELALMKPSAMLINTSRGPLVDEDALFDVLDKGRIRGAAMDVFWQEPMPENDRWRTTKWGTDGRSQVVMTPHTGYMSEETLHAWWTETAKNVRRYLNGEDLVDRLA